jgi:lipoate-protein ligase B
LQERVHQAVARGDNPTIIALEHPPVITFGKNASAEHLLVPKAILAMRGVESVQTDRGGELTAHEPGQLVVYPIVPVTSVRKYVRCLEESVIQELATYGITAATDSEYPGVWVGHEKICAIGVRVKDRVSMHGLALNVCNTLATFSLIVPCGIKGRGVTTMRRLLDRRVDVADVQRGLLARLRENLAAPT